MRDRAYCAHPSIRDHWALRCMSRYPDQVVSLKRDPQCLSPQASLILIYRPTEEMKGEVDLAQPEDRTMDPVVWKRDTLPLGHRGQDCTK
ncbi:hypothetical protein TNCV_2383091 [Trichonephila clavipes]|nr:hypothetical protein TNCV_4899901 [Trichonephila clavipes]GFV10993.1 hypothetical protein TNCV_2383091 [Trichonephila clavipes]